MKVAEWITRFAYLNLLWVMFSLLGLLVLGLMPATAAMFSIHRKWYRGEEDFNVFLNFWKYYKKGFLEANGIGFSLLLIGLFLYIDIQLLSSLSNWLGHLFLIILFVAFYIFIGVLIHIFPVYVHFNLTFLQYFKYAFHLAICQPIKTLLMGIGVILLVLLFLMFPMLLLICSGSLISGFLIGSTLTAYNHLAKNNQNNISY
nr:DUF624 domain-containing protein [Aquibacillus albus]